MAALHALDATPARAAADFVRKFYAMWGEGGTPNRDRVAMMTAEAKAIIWPAKDAEALEPGILLSNAGCLLSQASGVIEMARHYIEDSCPGAGSSIIEAMFGALELIEQGSKAIDQAGNIMDGRA